MFPFKSGELSFRIPNDVVENTNTFTNTSNHFLQPHLIDNTTSNLVIKSAKTKRGPSKANTNKPKNNANLDNNNEISGNAVDKKKITHREVERQRRQEMSNLHFSLRSLLPDEYIRGKRSVCDHVAEAAKYITELEKNVKELGEKRDQLKNSLPSSEHPAPSTTSTSEYNVSIHKFSKTLQIEIAAGPFPLSKAFGVLDNEGLDVVSCVSSKVNHRWMYVIYCEIDDVTSLHTSSLHEKLMSVVSSCET